MNAASFIRLVALSAIWGGSFLFMRVAAPVFGPAWLVFGRVGIGALFLLGLAYYLNKSRHMASNWRHFTIIAFFNSALPFFLFAVAAASLNASQLSVLNATAPVWAYLIAVFIREERFQAKRICGILLGILGVYLIFDKGSMADAPVQPIPVICSLLAAFSYGIATTYTKRAKVAVEPFLNALGSMIFATLLVAPALLFFPMKSDITLVASGSVFAIGVLCSGVAYLLYFRLIKDLGATSALTVTFLIPIFGTLWGFLLLGEDVGGKGVIGMLVVIAGTIIVTNFDVRLLLRKINP